MGLIFDPISMGYRVCHGFRLTKQMIIFESVLTTFEASNIFGAAGAVVEIGLSLNILNFNHVKLVQIRNT